MDAAKKTLHYTLRHQFHLEMSFFTFRGLINFTPNLLYVFFVELEFENIGSPTRVRNVSSADRQKDFFLRDPASAERVQLPERSLDFASNQLLLGKVHHDNRRIVESSENPENPHLSQRVNVPDAHVPVVLDFRERARGLTPLVVDNVATAISDQQTPGVRMVQEGVDIVRVRGDVRDSAALGVLHDEFLEVGPVGSHHGPAVRQNDEVVFQARVELEGRLVLHVDGFSRVGLQDLGHLVGSDGLGVAIISALENALL